MNEQTKQVTVPMAELHCHLKGTVEPEDAIRLAKRHGMEISSILTEDGAFNWRTFNEFLASYDAVSEVVRTGADYHDITLSYFERMAARGVIYGEIFVSPAHAMRFDLSYEALIEAVTGALTEAEAKHGITGRIIVTCVRNWGVKHAEQIAGLTVKHPSPMVTGFGMAGDEAFGAVSDYKRAFEIAGGAGLGLTAHAGEVLGPEHIRQTLDVLNVTRLGHGVRAVTDASLIEEIKTRGIVLEVCPSSNLAIGLYDSIDDHPVGVLVEAGVAVTLSSDDPAFFGAQVADEYALVRDAFDYDEAQLLAFTRTAIEAAFCDEATRMKLRDRLE
jgi:adenosine deaminase